MFRLKDVVVALAVVISRRVILERPKIAERLHVKKTVPQLFQVLLFAEFEEDHPAFASLGPESHTPLSAGPA
jgi:hypothetical protein